MLLALWLFCSRKARYFPRGLCFWLNPTTKNLKNYIVKFKVFQSFKVETADLVICRKIRNAIVYGPQLELVLLHLALFTSSFNTFAVSISNIETDVFVKRVLTLFTLRMNRDVNELLIQHPIVVNILISVHYSFGSIVSCSCNVPLE